MLMLIPVIGPPLVFASWAVLFAIEVPLYFVGKAPLFGVTGNALTLFGLVLMAMLF